MRSFFRRVFFNSSLGVALAFALLGAGCAKQSSPATTTSTTQAGSTTSTSMSSTSTSTSTTSVSQTSVVQAQATGTGHYDVTASCPSGTYLFGGGCSQGDISSSTALTDNGPSSATQWHCKSRDVSVSTNRTTTASAICAPPVTSQEVITASNVGTGHYTVEAYCSSGNVVLGGGCDQGGVSESTAITDSGPVSTMGWHCRTRDITTSTSRTTAAYAICAPQPSGYEVVTNASTGTGHYSVEAYCSSGKTLLGGGCSQGDVSSSTALTDSTPIGTSGWHCRTRDLGVSTSRTTTVYAICAATN